MPLQTVTIGWTKTKRDKVLLHVLTAKGIGFKMDRSGFTVKTTMDPEACRLELAAAVDRRLAADAVRTARRKRRSGYLGRLASDGPAPGGR